MAVLIQQAFEMDGYQDIILFKKSETIYLESVKKDSSSFQANYNIGSLYCNYSSHLTARFREQKNNFTFFEKVSLNHKRKKYYNKGLFYMERALRIKKRKK